MIPDSMVKARTVSTEAPKNNCKAKKLNYKQAASNCKQRSRIPLLDLPFPESIQ